MAMYRRKSKTAVVLSIMGNVCNKTLFVFFFIIISGFGRRRIFVQGVMRPLTALTTVLFEKLIVFHLFSKLCLHLHRRQQHLRPWVAFLNMIFFTVTKFLLSVQPPSSRTTTYRLFTTGFHYVSSNFHFI